MKMDVMFSKVEESKQGEVIRPKKKKRERLLIQIL